MEWRRMLRYGLMAFALGGTMLVGCDRQTPEAPDEGPPGPEEAGPAIEVEPVDPAALSEADYQSLVSAFYTGIVAMEVGDAERGVERLEAATGLVPGEPAGWANLALARMRANDMQAAAEAMAPALQLAPETSEVQLMAGLLDLRRQETEPGLDRIRRAIELDPSNWRARFALYDALQQASEPDEAARAEMQAQLEAISQGLPDNALPWLERAQLALEQEDAATLQAALDALEPISEGWDEDLRAQLESARGLAADSAADPRERSVAVVTLRNLLLPTADFQADMAQLQRDFAEVAPPIERFLILQTPDSSPAEPDPSIRFVAEPIEDAGDGWVEAAHLQADGPPSLILGFDDRIEIRPEAGAGEAIVIESPTAPLAPNGVLPIDWDNDQRVDIVLAGVGGLAFLHQTEDGGFEDVTVDTGLEANRFTDNYYHGGWAVDLDLEGDLDLILGRYQAAPLVLRNNGDGTWAESDALDLSAIEGLADLVWGDLDRDGDPDLALGETTTIYMARNDRSLGYTLVQLGEPSDLEEADAPSPRLLGLTDLDRDGRLDLTTSDGRRVRLPEEGPGAADLEPFGEIGGEIGFHRWADVDNNGAPDFIGNDFIGLAGGEQLVELPEMPRAEIHSAVDLDGDGWVDLVGEDGSGQPTVWMNQGGEQDYGWQVIRPRAVREGDQRNNSFGLGGELEVRAGLLYQKLPMDAPALHVGLGEGDGSDAIRIRWPNGNAQGEFDLAADAELVAEQRLAGSCPWLFAWDGEGMEFVTDVLWRSPLGLRINAQDTAGVVQTRDWVLVGGERLKARDGVYDLRVTAELRETHFFDEVKLLVADHPEGTLAWVDERFSFPPPPLSVQLTGPTAPVAGARDVEGRDISDFVVERDGRHFEDIGRGDYQGIAGDHWTEVELDPSQTLQTPEGEVTLAEAMADGSLRLVSTGWVYPTDSSINVAISQGGTTPPVDLAIEVQAADGSWQPWREGLGFPAGKHKTLLLDLGGAFEAGAPGPWRLRLRTTMEIYWDALRVARLLQETVEPVTLETSLAELRYRGFSMTNRMDGSAPVTQPETPDYERLAGTGQAWLDLEGFYTRFGPVGELLAETDDRYAILNAGDELAFEFEVPADPAPGMVRDFVFLSDGWVKDGNVATSYSATVRPLPSHDQPEYTLPGISGPLPALSEDPIYQRFPEDWARYHTRYVTNRRFHEAMQPRTR